MCTLAPVCWCLRVLATGELGRHLLVLDGHQASQDEGGLTHKGLLGEVCHGSSIVVMVDTHRDLHSTMSS